MARPKKKAKEQQQSAALTFDKDELVERMLDFNQRDTERASDAGTDRSEIGEFLKDTGINKRVFSISRGVLRMKKVTDQQDWLRSMKALLPIIEAQVGVQESMTFDPPAEAVQQSEKVVPIRPAKAEQDAPADEADGEAQEGYGDDDGEDGDPEIEGEAADFDAEADAIFGTPPVPFGEGDGE
jgi:hypothetical protein